MQSTQIYYEMRQLGTYTDILYSGVQCPLHFWIGSFDSGYTLDLK